ncbi:branched-chain amino acid ABC transporter permease [Aureimonas pseudogalii]|uniref:Branched-chain amino acid transport system permease protein n=1 Tax=Aureimonas pseudogalii TaxID=1744844 RepID=A0A7W6H7W5_9HYPH|nr:branched-chain amino acid ABC transporter permease [Aureimonas pseudogalii]MBB4000264.1 branched-chain amino acid transport system permease protein [Aureimonas pseudogalii]
MTSFFDLLLSGLMSGLVIGLGALAVTLVFGVARFPNAATGDVMSLSAYAALAAAGATGSMVLGGAGALLAGILLNVALYLLVFRKLADRRPVMSLLASIGVGFMVRAGLGLVYGQQPQVFRMPLTRPMMLFDMRIQPTDLKLAGVTIVTLVAVFLILEKTSIGRRMRAVSADPSLARVSGIDPVRVMLALWALAGAVSAMAGLILGMKTVVTPDMGWNMLLPSFAAAVLGGIGHPLGAVVAGVLLGVVQELATPFVGFTYKIAVAFAVLMLVLLVRPRGLFGRQDGAR